jgi:lactam utilization protein B
MPDFREIWDVVAEAIAAIDPRLVLFVMTGSRREALADIGARQKFRLAFKQGIIFKLQ